MLPFAVAIFTSAFLVFQVQPVIARFILPWYGGTPAVWTTCMLFFQLGLLAGYLYAHLLARYLRPRQQAVVHGSLLLLSLLLLPITPELPESTRELPQILEILQVLAVAVIFPFILLSASAPLLQHWFSRVHPGKSPFRLYALSNFGSLLALLSYPFLVEPALKLSTQTRAWSFGYLLFMVVTLWCAYPVLRQTFPKILKGQPNDSIFQNQGTQKPALDVETGWFDLVCWVLLAASGSIVLLAVTNQMSQDVAVIPFLWVVPLSLYLITFIICFERDAWYQRKIWIPFLVISVGMLVYLMGRDYGENELSLALQIFIYCNAVFGCCMVCHGEMVRRRPHAVELTKFYVFVALGGALGGLFVNLVAPLLFEGYWELHGILVFICLSAILLIALDKQTIGFKQRSAFVTLGLVGVGVMVWFLNAHISIQKNTSIFSKRGFFGILHVYEAKKGTRGHYRSLYYGRIRHGEQWLHQIDQYRATSYYSPHSGVALALNKFPSRKNVEARNKAIKVGVLGLGVGTVAAYGRSRDRIRFYEINKDIESTARNYFSYLENSRANIEVVIGDARLSMQQELESGGSQKYDVLIVDAFSGDAVPIHLLTQEASDLYWQHLKEDGVLVFHITNFHVDLSDVARQLAIHANKEAIYIEDDNSQNHLFDTSYWVMITSNQAFINDPEIKEYRDDWYHELRPIIWTDDFSNLFEVVDW